MTDERWAHVKELFQDAVERPPGERDAFLGSATGDDEALRREVESLLAADTAEGDFLDQLPVASESVLADPLVAYSTTMDPGPSHTVLAAGLRVGPYEIVAPLGAGGMGEVYRAHDIRLGRDVAIKTLPDQFARDRERVARLRREARTLASLNHPHIAAIYGLEEFDGADFLVLELVEGRASGGTAATYRGAANRRANRRGARSRSRTRHRPPRPQARERDDHTGRPGEGAGLRSGEGGL